MTRAERLALVPYPNVQGATPEEVVDALDILVAYNRERKERLERERRRVAPVGSPAGPDQTGSVEGLGDDRRSAAPPTRHAEGRRGEP